MTKAKVLNLEKVRSNIRKKITEALRDETIRQGIGEIIVQDIKQTKNFGTPAEGTLKWRERYETSNFTDEFYERNKLNATFTGELLDDLENNVRLESKKGILSFIVKQSDKFHKRYKKPKRLTRRKKKKKTEAAALVVSENKSIVTRAKYSEIQDWMINKYKYNYLKIEDFTRRNIRDFIQNALRKILVK